MSLLGRVRFWLKVLSRALCWDASARARYWNDFRTRVLSQFWTVQTRGEFLKSWVLLKFLGSILWFPFPYLWKAPSPLELQHSPSLRLCMLKLHPPWRLRAMMIQFLSLSQPQNGAAESRMHDLAGTVGLGL